MLSYLFSLLRCLNVCISLLSGERFSSLLFPIKLLLVGVGLTFPLTKHGGPAKILAQVALLHHAVLVTLTLHAPQALAGWEG